MLLEKQWLIQKLQNLWACPNNNYVAISPTMFWLCWLAAQYLSRPVLCFSSSAPAESCWPISETCECDGVAVVSLTLTCADTLCRISWRRTCTSSWRLNTWATTTSAIFFTRSYEDWSTSTLPTSCTAIWSLPTFCSTPPVIWRYWLILSHYSLGKYWSWGYAINPRQRGPWHVHLNWVI